MRDRPVQADSPPATEADKNYYALPPAVSLPKGGGAIKGMGEKFAANPVTGTGSISVPIATSPGRSGLGPQLSLSYDSGAGNGIFGLGWNLSLPSITRKTDKGLPRYQDELQSDVFILSGAEDLVPILVQNETGNWVSEELHPCMVGENTYRIQRYRPRIEGLFARIECWTNQADATDTFWRSISKDNITTLYGKTENSRIADPNNLSHVFSWLICESYDDKGNAIRYHYKAEDSDGISLAQAHEQNRASKSRSANRYLKHIYYGNQISRLVKPELTDEDWLFEVVFDYGEHHLTHPKPDDSGMWAIRNDPFSSYRSGFEVRTYRLCQRVLMFHHIPDLADGTKGYDGLVRSTDFTYSYEQQQDVVRDPIYSYLQSVSQTGYKRNGNEYIQKSLPPLEFTYSEAIIDETVREVDRTSLENLPDGLDGTRYQWVDLNGEGLSGILTEQGNGWFYKRNLSPINTVPKGSKQIEAQFAPVERVSSKPASGLANGAQFFDLAGDGQLDVVSFRGAVPGFYQRTHDEGWESFTAFKSLPVLDWDNPNLKFIDLNGDGHSDILITEDHCFVWHPSLAADGFGAAERVSQPWDEEKGPSVIFADSTQSIHLADMSGDGLTDIVRIRNGEVCYWPNLGYGRFGAKITMDHAPWFDALDIFNQRRIVLADIDGSGTTDILYLSGNGVQVYFNQSGNSWSAKRILKSFPAIDSVASVTAIDLLGNGTACLVWSSPLPGNARRAMRYIDLMGGQKPHLLVKTVNNLGAETSIEYAPSTKFYLQDRLAGKPWVTKLPFPVHCVEKVTVTDTWRKTRFSTSYTYHHGYFDGVEREFRGFGRVEQLDVESYGEFANGNSASPYITADKTLYQPPIKTVTWHHTGALLENKRILSQFKHEYFPNWFENLQPDIVNVLGTFQENDLPEPDLADQDLSAEEWREALRACKGMLLRQEVYELDLDALEQGEHRPVKLFSTAYHNCHIQRLQAQGINNHAVFLVVESEAITYHYELDLTSDNLTPDPRIAHTLNLSFDEYGNVLQSVAVVYPRLGQFADSSLKTDVLTLIRQVQGESHLAYTETRFTNDVVPKLVNGALTNLDTYRLRIPCEVLTYELTGIPKEKRYFTSAELRRFQLSPVHQLAGETVEEIPYHQLPLLNRERPQKRLVEHARSLFFKDDEAVLSNPLPLGQLGRLGLSYENYRLALTEDLLGCVFGAKLAGEDRDKLSNSSVSGYLSGAALATRFPGSNTTGQYWIRSGIAGFAPDAAQHFYLPERYTDSFGNVTTLQYDPRDLYVASSTDAMQNRTEVTEFDFRVLAPCRMKDANLNLSEVRFDVLGMPAAIAVMGKGNEADNLNGFDDALLNLSLETQQNFFVNQEYDVAEAKRLLGSATARHIYYFGEVIVDGKVIWGQHPACACGIVRERHAVDMLDSPVQCSFEYSDGMGSVVVKKVQAEPEKPGQPLRWVANGKTILNNKGKAVKQYEPYFSSVGHRYEEPKEEGVTPVIYYDAAGRTVQTELPNGSYSRVEFSPWHVTSYDPNDTVLEADNEWFSRRTDPTHPDFAIVGTVENQRAAQFATAHADTPSLTLLDSLGREVISIAHNRVKDAAGVVQNEKYVTFTKLDAEGKPLWIQDARGNRVMEYINRPGANTDYAPCYDIAGNLLFQHSMDAGDKWMLNDAAGKPMLGWTVNNQRIYRFHTEYDALHRPTGSFVKGADPLNANREIQFEKIVYGDTPTNDLTEIQKTQLNLRGKPYQQFDTAGIVVSKGQNPTTGADEAFDFKGNLLRSTRQLIRDPKTTPDWSQAPALEEEIFSSSTRYDALNRPIQMVAPHSNRLNTKLNVIRPGYNEANLLERVDVWLKQTAEPITLLNPTTANLKAVTNIDYDAKGQRLRIEYNEANHPVITEYTYDPKTFRLARLLSTRPKHLEANKRTLQDLSYTYDPVGNITEIRDRAQQTVFFDNSLIEPSNTYVYDALYRLVQAEGREHAVQNNVQRDAKTFESIAGIPFPNSPEALQRYTEAYKYDSVGNILEFRHTGGKVERWVRNYQYALDSNQLLATRLPGEANNLPDYVDVPGYGGVYTYDIHGNMTSMPHLKVMEWDFKDQLHATQQQVVKNDIGEKTYYVYDAGGQRVRKVTETQNSKLKDERIYLGGFEVYRKYNGDGQTVVLERETLHIMDDKQQVALVETKTITNPDDQSPVQLIRFQIGNHLGSAALELDDQAQVISYEEYHPYGSTAYHAARSQTEMPKRYRYTGKERDEETGFSYHGARYYAPWLGRWTAADPSGIVAGLNSFEYCNCSPTTFLDDNGRDPTPAPQHFPIGVGGLGKPLVFRLIEDAKNVRLFDSEVELPHWAMTALGGVFGGVQSAVPTGVGSLIPSPAPQSKAFETSRGYVQTWIGAAELYIGLTEVGIGGGAAPETLGLSTAAVPTGALVAETGAVNVAAGGATLAHATSLPPDGTPPSSTSRTPNTASSGGAKRSSQQLTRGKQAASAPAPKISAVPQTLRSPHVSIADNIAREGGLTDLANQIKGLGQGKGATVEIALATKDGKQILVAGINTGATKGLNTAQLKQLEEWGVNVAPQSVKGMAKGPHAEQNIAAYLKSIGARGERWSKAVVGAHESGNSYICDGCKDIIKLVGGRIENTPP